MESIFISYSRDDLDFARRLTSELRRDGVRVWLDEGEMLVGDSSWDKIESAIEEHNYLGVVLSPNSVCSDWVRIEVNMALSRERPGRPKVLPLLLAECTIPARLADRIYADFRHEFTTGYGQILSRLTREAYDRSHPKPDEEEWARHLHERARRMADALSRARVLVVNDYPDTIRPTISILEAHGVKVATTTTTDDAIRLMSESDFDLVISDMHRGGNDQEGQRFLERTVRMGIDRPTIFLVYHFQPERGIPPYAFGMTRYHEEAVQLVFDAIERGRGWARYR